MRWDDSPELFGNGCGTSTCGDFTCGICGNEYNKGNDANEDYSGDSEGVTEFAGIEVCGNCFEAIETEILGRMKHILPWYRKIVERRRESLDMADTALKSVGA